MSVFFNKEKIKEEEMLSFTKGMYYLLKGKISITDSLNIISVNYKGNLKNKIIKTKRDIEKGTGLSRAFSRISENKEFLEMIKITEETGKIEEIFKNLYEKYQFRQKIRKEIKNLSIYPVFVISTALIIVFILLKTVVPKFKTVYSDIDQELPRVTQNIIKISEFTDKYWILLIFFLFLSIFSIYYFFKKYKRTSEKLILKTAIIGKIYREIKILNFTKNMHSLLSSGISLTEALKLCGNSQSELLNEEIDRILKRIEKGEEIQKSFKNSTFFDREYTVFLSVGEKTGDMTVPFFNLNEIYYERVSEKIKVILKIMEPLSVIFLGFLIGFTVYSVMLPIFKIGEIL